tara:strand:- start:1353 stop:1913 length:561 start_codon:yes stop_codon:yes gene_type:complete
MNEAFRKDGIPVQLFREPTDGYWGKKVRKLLYQGRGNVAREEELEWFINDRREDVELNILPALENKNIVLIDRYYYSTAAYQGALGLDSKEIIRVNERFAPTPDLTFIFEVPVDICIERICSSREEKTDEFEKKEYLEKVQIVFDGIDGPQIRRINGSDDIDKVRKNLMKVVISEFPELANSRGAQ